MTQPASTTAIPASIQAPQPQPAPAPPQAPAAQPINLMDQILLASDLGDNLQEAREVYSKLRLFTRHQFPDGTDWNVGGTVPGHMELVIYCGFCTEFVSKDTEGVDFTAGDYRFYVMPAGVIQNPLAPDFMCFTFNRAAGGFNVENMSLETFVAEIAKEYWNLAVVQGHADDGDDEEK